MALGSFNTFMVTVVIVKSVDHVIKGVIEFDFPVLITMLLMILCVFFIFLWSLKYAFELDELIGDVPDDYNTLDDDKEEKLELTKINSNEKDVQSISAFGAIEDSEGGIYACFDNHSGYNGPTL